MSGIYRVLLVFVLVAGVSGCSKMRDWKPFDWGKDSNGDEVYEEDYTFEEEMDFPEGEEIYAEEDVIYVDEDGNVVEAEEEVMVIDDYGDEPDGGASEMQNTVPSATAVYFDYKKVTVPASYIGDLQRHADYLRGNPAVVLNVEGHTDGTANDQYNYELGLRRAREVAKLLADMGAPRSQLSVISFGKERPAVSGSGESAGALNRRVELIYN